jgi:cold shock CspA family protein
MRDLEWRTGYVHWFDSLSGEGIIKDNEKHSYFVHYSAIESDEQWKTLIDGQQVEFKLITDTTFKQVCVARAIKTANT